MVATTPLPLQAPTIPVGAYPPDRYLPPARNFSRRVVPSLFPKQQQGDYERLFAIPVNSQNQLFVANPQRQDLCLGTTPISYRLVEGRVVMSNL